MFYGVKRLEVVNGDFWEIDTVFLKKGDIPSRFQGKHIPTVIC